MIQDNSIDLNNINWLNLLFRVLLNVNSIAAKALIESGATSFIKQTRNSMVFEYNTASNLTKKETAFLIENIANYDTLSNALKYLLDNGKINKNRRKIIEDMVHSIFSPPFSLEDTAEWISDVEDAALGCSITCAKVDMYDISMTNTTCRDFKNGINKDNIILGGEIDFINITKTKSGKTAGSEMAFVTLCDTTGSIDSVIFFPEKYKQYKNILFPGNVIIVKGNRSKNGDSLVVENAYVAKS
jgi:DNA polymerase III alpha subunit